ncbi:hypothetical protein DNU06_10835 [Putridiphycobacter roseus]|uniref:Uncharacterized protein n=2 Tax=Putridiphycobacter roseus TaxID=2219161 RepID=A0A2W1MY30_9FLAO|nr:hypothetical protein DNU06_10835 [Putridiphycobacter roseus]
MIAFGSFNVHAKPKDSLQCLIFNHTSKNKTIAFENKEYLVVWTKNADGFLQETEGFLNIKNDSTIKISDDTIALHEIIGFNKNSIRKKKVGKGFIISGASLTFLGVVGVYALTKAKINNFTQFISFVVLGLITGGVVIAGLISTFAGIAIKESAESKQYKMDVYEPQIKWVYD